MGPFSVFYICRRNFGEMVLLSCTVIVKGTGVLCNFFQPQNTNLALLHSALSLSLSGFLLLQCYCQSAATILGMCQIRLGLRHTPNEAVSYTEHGIRFCCVRSGVMSLKHAKHKGHSFSASGLPSLKYSLILKAFF